MEEPDVKAMEEFVESCRQNTNVQASRQNESNDILEPGMLVPVSVLNKCSNSFTSTDEKRQKASTQFFADTGLMAMLCRHDRVLWTANMTSAGKNQHYIFALLQMLFKHLPCNTTVRILYNIGCQTHRSCVKWGFLQEYQPRMSFTISVFHAFSHQWPCQIVYHPRKRTGFGLTDGEGCERFWSALKKLIPGLRVSRVSDLLPFVLCWILCLLVSPKNIYAGRPSQTSWQTVTSLTWSLALPALVPLPAQEAYCPFYAGFLWSPWSSPSDGVVKSIKGTDETCTM